MAFTSGIIPAIVAGILGVMIFWQWVYVSSLYIVSFFMGKQQDSITRTQSFAYILGPNSVWVLVPIVGLYVSIRLLVDGSYSILGL